MRPRGARGSATCPAPLRKNGGVAGYTLRNLKEVEDAAPRFGLAPNIEARFARSPLETENLGLTYQRLAPNYRIPFGHHHAEQEEVYVVLGGSMRAKLDDDIVELRPWDALRVSGETVRSFEAGADGVEFLVVGVGPQDNGEVVRDWWAADAAS